MTIDNLLAQLNPPQREAVTYLDGPLLVLAGAGSGKTRVLTYKIAYLIARAVVRPEEILALTFTNKAANEMKHRVEQLLGMDVRGLWIGTFHSICARILRREIHHLGFQRNFTIYDAGDQLAQIERIMQFLNLNRDLVKPRQVQYVISQCKNKMMDALAYEKTATDFVSQQIAKIYLEYETALRRNNALDFDDLLIKPLQLFSERKDLLARYQERFKYVLVDEYQDTNKAQYHLVRLLSQPDRVICVVGDEDQSIYTWRGADITNILSFEKDFPDCRVIRLEQNYRSTQTILDAANEVVARNTQRLGKTLWSENGQGDPIEVIATASEIDEARQVVGIIAKERARGIGYNEMAILYRTNAQSRALEDQLRRTGIPYTIVGGTKFYERKEIKDLLAYLRVLVNPTDSLALRRIINVPARGIGEVSLQHLQDYADREGISLYQALAQAGRIEQLTPRAQNKMHHFISLLEEIRREVDQVNALEIASRVVEQFGLRAMYENSPDPQDQARVENINELLNSMAQFVDERPDPVDQTLAAFLEEVSLVTDIDNWDPDSPVVTLMTLHSAKGLEFPVVMITGLEDGLFPLSRSLEENEEKLEEERRLFYVGMTRAKQRLYLLWAKSRRRFWGDDFASQFQNVPSRFLREIPARFKQERDLTGVSESPATRFVSLEDAAWEEAAGTQEEGQSYQPGQVVVHDTFGRGEILAVESSRHGTKLTIRFGRAGVKKIVAEYANLELL
ncbi:MAG: hypothetical protein D6715_11775 [Calditrichaeota bacterium]|nr:MAG: hypothetical protein D6715_11775 [Calditrichota bacterium]